jgi:CDP-diacylglycerol--glycerol-3-phosphate 3-phosphatidyltransferase
MFTAWARKTFRSLLESIARACNAAGLSPNHLTVLGLLLQLVIGILLAVGKLPLGGFLLIFFSAFDAVDGTLARLAGKGSRFGAFLDACVDRYAEGFTLGGLMVYFAGQGAQLPVLLLAASLVGSFVVSYTRAKAESLGLSCTVGILTRAERVALLVVGLIFYQWQPIAALPDFLTLVLWVLAILSNVTALQRIWHVRQITADERAPSEN